ncbi:MAG TPA: hypothetical protein ENI23_17115 [bacterium]|nr:hypothetical protein [bacterium]
MNNIQGIDKEKLQEVLDQSLGGDTSTIHALGSIFSCLASIEPEKCTLCNGAFQYHHHKHVTRKGTYHTSCYKERKKPESEQRMSPKCEENTPKCENPPPFGGLCGSFEYCKYCYPKATPTNRLDVIRERLGYAVTSPFPMEDTSYLIDLLDTALEALELVLPMAKSYVYKNHVGSNRKYIETAEIALTKIRNNE